MILFDLLLLGGVLWVMFLFGWLYSQPILQPTSSVDLLDCMHRKQPTISLIRNRGMHTGSSVNQDPRRAGNLLYHFPVPFESVFQSGTRSWNDVSNGLCLTPSKFTLSSPGPWTSCTCTRSALQPCVWWDRLRLRGFWVVCDTGAAWKKWEVRERRISPAVKSICPLGQTSSKWFKLKTGRTFLFI